MQYKNNKVSDIQIAYIGGGSRGWAWTFMTDLALEPQISGTIRLYDIDVQAHRTMPSSETAFQAGKMRWGNGHTRPAKACKRP